VDEFISELIAAVDRSESRTRLVSVAEMRNGAGAAAAAAAESNLARLLGQHADLAHGPKYNASGISAPRLAAAVRKLRLDLPLKRAHTIVK